MKRWAAIGIGIHLALIARAESGLAPLGVRNLRAQPLMFLRMEPSLFAGKFLSQWQVQIANDFKYVAGNPNVVFEDYELTRLTFSRTFFVAPSYEILGSITWVDRGPGFLDSLIDSWHENVLGQRNLLRSNRPNGRTTFFANGKDEGRGSGFSDATFTVRAKAGRYTIGLAGKLPLGSPSDKISSGAFDFGVSLARGFKLSSQFSGGFHFARVRQGESQALNQEAPTVDALAIWTAWDRRWLLQWQREDSAAQDGVQYATTSRHAILSLGYRWKTGRLAHELFISEDGDFATSLTSLGPDFAVGYRVRF